MGFEASATGLHRGALAVAFIFVRTDKAGNISKRRSRRAFTPAGSAAARPLWVHDVRPAEGSSARWLLAGVTSGWPRPPLPTAQAGPHKNFAVRLRARPRARPQTVYSTGVVTGRPGMKSRSGAGCKICNRTSCAQRAFPCLGSRDKSARTRRSFALFVDRAIRV